MYCVHNRVSLDGLIERIEIPGPAIVFEHGGQHALRSEALYNLFLPDPALEKNKKLLVYDPSVHDYSVDKPVWEEIANGHFVYGNQRELEGYRKEYESQL